MKMFVVVESNPLSKSIFEIGKKFEGGLSMIVLGSCIAWLRRFTV